MVWVVSIYCPYMYNSVMDDPEAIVDNVQLNNDIRRSETILLPLQGHSTELKESNKLPDTIQCRVMKTASRPVLLLTIQLTTSADTESPTLQV